MSKKLDAILSDAADRFLADTKAAEEAAALADASGRPADRLLAELAAIRAGDSRGQLANLLLAVSPGVRDWRGLMARRWGEKPSRAFRHAGRTFRVVFDGGSGADSDGARVAVA